MIKDNNKKRGATIELVDDSRKQEEQPLDQKMILEYKGRTIDPIADDGLQEEQQFDL